MTTNPHVANSGAKPIRRVLVANRGEIARRVFRTCKALGIDTVAVFSDADAAMPFVREADVAIRIGPSASADSYLRGDVIIEAARATGADAIHPGYGFLSENAAFAQACADAGIRFIGPSPDAIRAMGLKRESKLTVAAAGVPVVPGYNGVDQRAEVLVAAAVDVGFPLLVKASAGGGGKGMRVVRHAADLPAAIDAAKREAAASFGDDTVILERYVDQPRHIEIQVLGDHHGNVVHLFERECSIQRRHQKVIEEAPSPALDDATRNRMGDAAVAAARAIGYASAGTVEFIMGADGAFFFLEMNTRLQVEHPVTEAITGVDLVEEQLRVAEGHPLRFGQASLTMQGAAIECRLYAEDAANGFLPATGTVTKWHRPEQPWLRVDAGVDEGDTISIHYDPMIAKVITHGPDRETARRRMSRALREMSLAGLTTNRGFLVRLVEHPAFAAGALDTHFIERFAADLHVVPDAAATARAAVAAALFGHEQRRAERTTLPAMRTGFRNVRTAPQRVVYDAAAGTVEVAYVVTAAGDFDITTTVEGSEAVSERWSLIDVNPRGIRARLGDIVKTFIVASTEAGAVVSTLDAEVALTEQPRFPERATDDAVGGCRAPMPGKIVRVDVAVGDEVTRGQILVLMEAMKMEQPITAPADGRVAEVRVAVGDQVDADAILVAIDT